MNLKKILALILVLCMSAAFLAACGSSEPASTSSGSQPAAEAPAATGAADKNEQKKVLFSTISLEGGMSIFDTLLKPLVEGYGYYYECVSCEGDAVKQIEQVENAVVQGFDLIYIWPVTGEALSDCCKAAMDAGVYVYVFLNDTQNYNVLFKDDPTENGTMTANMALDWVSKTFPDAAPGSVNAAIIGNANDDYNVKFGQALRDIVGADPRINILEDMDTDYSTTAAQAAAENIMTMHPDQQINLWLSIANVMTDGIDAAVTAENSGAGDLSKVGLITPAPLSEEVVEKVKLAQENKTIYRGILSTGGDLGQNFANIVGDFHALLEGEEVPSIRLSPCEPVWYEDLPNYGF